MFERMLIGLGCHPLQRYRAPERLAFLAPQPIRSMRRQRDLVGAEQSQGTPHGIYRLPLSIAPRPLFCRGSLLLRSNLWSGVTKPLPHGRQCDAPLIPEEMK